MKTEQEVQSMFDWARRHQLERIRKAGKHTCIAVKSGAVRRVTGCNNVTLKRPVLIHQFYGCKICGRDMAKEGK